ncbi:hypothetical protein ACVDG3_05890 [Meridianimarinicoccus sp. RP-17]|uniref:hypothetical protein n=1 Tax=Meridianimarinicoccus zhengii TaxID=2056810 RepID=UPI001C9AE25C|nr:hypothetical protein [Phycocomes zhengii]
MNKLLALFALAIIGVFIGILAVNVPSPDLIAVAVLTFGLVAYDFVTSARDPKD